MIGRKKKRGKEKVKSKGKKKISRKQNYIEGELK